MNGGSGQRDGCQERMLIVLGTAVTCALLLALWLMGEAHVRVLGTILVTAVSVMIVLIGVALVVRMWRRKDMTGEVLTNNHYYHDGTKTVVRERVLDGRAIEAPKLYQLPAQGQGGAFPELLRASYAAGMIAQRSATPGAQAGARRAEDETVYPEWTEVELNESIPDGWDGDIR